MFLLIIFLIFGGVWPIDRNHHVSLMIDLWLKVTIWSTVTSACARRASPVRTATWTSTSASRRRARTTPPASTPSPPSLASARPGSPATGATSTSTSARSSSPLLYVLGGWGEGVEGGREARNLHLIWGLHFNRFRMKQESVVGLRSSWTGFYWIKTDWIGLRFSFSFSFDLIGLKWIGLGWIEIFIRFYWIKTGWIGSKFSFSFCFIGLKWIRLDRKCLFSFDFIGLRRAGLEWIELDSVSFNY